MAPIPVKIKHAGKVHDVQLDPDQPATAFKDAVYQLTGVPPDRMKVMIKGGILKDDTDLRKIAAKPGQTFMVIGAAGELPKPPETPIKFLEDMDESSLAEALAMPVGLVNLGNTCYMNATLQAMRAIPELQLALQSSTTPGLPMALRNLYTNMAKTTESVTPSAFLAALRQAFPQFAERTNPSGGLKAIIGGGYAQQDAEECWVQLTNSLKEVPGLPGPSGSNASQKFVDQFMTGELRRVLKCDEAPDEPESVTYEKVLKISCNISNAVNYMQQGIIEALDGKIEKQSPSLGREAVYTSTSRMSRLPTYLTVHMVRFAWKRDIGKKAKIMRRVKFPTEYDALEIATPELREKLLPVSRKLKEVEKERAERRKVRKRTKAAKPIKDKEGDVQMADASAPEAGSSSGAAGAPAASAEGEDKGKAVMHVELEDEHVYREREGKELEALIHPDIKADVGASTTGQYELVAIVTHKGAEADAGHYIGFAKKRILHTSPLAPGASAGPAPDEDDEDWYKFDDDKVSIFPAEKLETLSGGGQDASAYVLLYRSRPLV
ncbi:cysteine proteinase [Trametes coccinea BRFM310]|uniref:Ubiquitin carboxyl-terminal hydrolase n=1 Tax=Trametes coccinea (strain BRFM310) TaxID=1353009 RepID=A0A1Y2J1J0_TRAC3|nr:cysteine proteinase [Trametes coccinea BRFM310]